MPIFKYLKNLKSFSIIIVPDDTSHEAKSKKFTVTRIFIFAVIYSILIALFGYYFFNITGIANRILPGTYVQNAETVEEIEELNDKVIFLAKELQLLKSANQKLKYAMALGDSTLIDSFKVNPDTLRKYYKTPKEGTVFGVLISIMQNLFIQQQDNTIFFILPVNGYISRSFDPERAHYGIDIVVKDGTPVYAAAGGFVVFSGYTNNYGHIIILSHSDGYLSIYKHNSVILKKEREFVKQGELIAQSGNSGLATTGPHLHFEIWHNGKPVDPETLLIITNK
ncbi:MAG: M23 family metallopeptidase [Ignavibacteriaceae bacterium]|nr:M23 family metallopeptidase [Ignavibacteriaceae bacterium]